MHQLILTYPVNLDVGYVRTYSSLFSLVVAMPDEIATLMAIAQARGGNPSSRQISSQLFPAALTSSNMSASLQMAGSVTTVDTQTKKERTEFL